MALVMSSFQIVAASHDLMSPKVMKEALAPQTVPAAVSSDGNFAPPATQLQDF